MQVRVMHGPKATDYTTYHNCRGVVVSRQGDEIIARWKSGDDEDRGVPYIEKRIPYDGHEIFVMGDNGKTITGYRIKGQNGGYSGSTANGGDNNGNA